MCGSQQWHKCIVTKEKFHRNYMMHLEGVWLYQAAQAKLDGDTKEYLKSHLFLAYATDTYKSAGMLISSLYLRARLKEQTPQRYSQYHDRTKEDTVEPSSHPKLLSWIWQCHFWSHFLSQMAGLTSKEQELWLFHRIYTIRHSHPSQF